MVHFPEGKSVNVARVCFLLPSIVLVPIKNVLATPLVTPSVKHLGPPEDCPVARWANPPLNIGMV